MERLTAAIQAERGLAAWLLSGLWKRGFDRGSLSRAEGLANRHSVKIEAVEHVRGESVICDAGVLGSSDKRYPTRVGFFPVRDTWKMESECACPVGWYCKHGAAVALLAIRPFSVHPTLPSFPHSKSSPPSPPAPPRDLDPMLREWLRQIDCASRTAATANVWDAVPAAPTRFLAYCIEPAPGAGWRLTLHIAQMRKNGTFTISSSNAQADPSNPQKYMTRDDIVPTSFYHRRANGIGQWGDMRLEGGGWEELLEACHATGHLFAYRPADGEWVPVSFGESARVEAVWEIMTDGGARPVLRLPGGNGEILPTDPPRYLDSATGALGLLEGDLPAAVLAAWQRGPRVAAGAIAEVAVKLQSIAPGAPPPVAVETVELPAIRPVPHLRISRGDPADPHFPADLIHARLRIRYAAGPLLPPLEGRENSVHTHLSGNRRCIQTREAVTEQAALKRVLRFGLFHLREAYNARVLLPDNRDAIIVEDPVPSSEAAWLDIISNPDFQQLRDDGWVIEIDPRSGLVIHDAGDFFPEIEAHPDHGIDWFQFDAHFELDGRRLSLIPIIARAIREGFPAADSPDLPEFLVVPCEDPADGHLRFPARRLMEIVDQVRHLFHGSIGSDGPLRIDRVAAAGVADALTIDSSETTRALAALGHSLKNISSLPPAELPATVRAELRPYQLDGYRWLRFLAGHGLHGILADDMGLGKTLQTLAHLAASRDAKPGKPSLVIAPTSVVPNWAEEAAKFTPKLKILVLHGADRSQNFKAIAKAHVVISSYPLLVRDLEIFAKQDWHIVVLDEAQYIKNPKSITARAACDLRAAHRVCLSGTPMENHLGELWSLMRFLMPGFLGDEKSFNSRVRKPIERDRSSDAQLALNRRVSPLILRRTKDQVATDLPAKTQIVHHIELTKKQTDLYESVRAAMDKRVRDAIADKGLAKSHIVVLDALLKLRQICCHPQLLKIPAAQKVLDSAKLDFLTDELLPTLLEEGRRILLFSSFTSMLALIEAHLEKQGIPYLKLTGQTTDRATLVKKFQTGEIPIFLISLKAGGTGLNLTAADTVIHYDPWWNPAAENQATDRAHRIGQTKPVFVHKLVCAGTIEDRILDLQKHKAALVEALLTEETGKLRIDHDTLSHLLAPLE